MNGADITYSWALPYLFSVLEPRLGILLARLPVIQPVRIKIVNSAIVGWIESKISSTPGSSSSRNKASSGQRQPEELRIAFRSTFTGSIDDFKTHNAVESHSMGDLDDQGLLPSEQDRGDKTIQITRGWGIHTQFTK